ncbi:glycerophosphoryldiester phosphodiesterase [Vairimorpha necatrix]|uniref:Glycerophosphoryldiester phosphodiesterase n=1 Tax=Vairimorpha necatrix TaxID=6039 RepID=A0AAX4JCD9_9MICR
MRRVFSFMIVEIYDISKDITIMVNQQTRIVAPVLFNNVRIIGNSDSKIFINDKEINSEQATVNVGSANILITRENFYDFQFTNEKNLGVVGHRGLGMDNGDVLENTIESFELALKKVKWVEMDVQLAYKKTPVIFHDTLIYDEETKEHHTEKGEKVIMTNDFPPTLNQVLQALKGKGGINLEIKYPINMDPLIQLSGFNEHDIESDADVGYDVPFFVDSIFKIIYKNNFTDIVFSSFSPYVLLYIKTRHPDARVLLLTDKYYEIINPFCTGIKLSGLVFNYRSFKTEDISKLSECLDKYVYDVFTKEEYENCVSMNIRGVITDNIDELLST